jgi:hypothetical protein
MPRDDIAVRLSAPAAELPFDLHILCMGPALSTLILFALLGSVGYAGYRSAETSRAMKRRILLGGTALIAVTGLVVWFLSTKVPETPGSPGTLVMLTLIWLFGGVGGVLMLSTMVGAAFAKPMDDSDE